MLQVFHEHEREVGVVEVVPSNAAVPVRTGSEAGVVASTRMQNNRRMHATAAGGAGPACAAAQRASRTTMCGWRGRQELHALFFDLPVITQLNSSLTSLFRRIQATCRRAASAGVRTDAVSRRLGASLSVI